MKRVKLDYMDVAPHRSEKVILSNISEHVAMIDKNIALKVLRNEYEKRASEEAASQYVVK